MSPPAEQPKRKDDRLSLLTNLHRSYGQTDSGLSTFAQDAAVMSQEFKEYQQQQQRQNYDEPEKIFCLRQQFLMVTAIIVVVSLVIFVLFVTTFRKVPNDDSFLNIDSLSGNPEFSSTHSQVAVKTSCGHVIGKAEDDAYAFKVSDQFPSILYLMPLK
ncbi:COesterase domain-containing protein [Caerostris darwini]|uniref:COesterase domain-containing protein n=1 Tax=Caerostris darwini TaxID=1538125 RepID=A0AAV4PX01_9ARAC|nr:COesterase domain-containing protein [Caerostris darwini]